MSEPNAYLDLIASENASIDRLVAQAMAEIRGTNEKQRAIDIASRALGFLARDLKASTAEIVQLRMWRAQEQQIHLDAMSGARDEAIAWAAKLVRSHLEGRQN